MDPISASLYMGLGFCLYLLGTYGYFKFKDWWRYRNYKAHVEDHTCGFVDLMKYT